MRKTILVVAALSCLAPVDALAARPAKDSAFMYCSSKNRCPFGFETNKAGTKLVNVKLYNDCATVPAEFPAIRVRKGGRFSASGTVTNVIGGKITYRIEGRFAKPTKAVGTYDADAKGCSEKGVRFAAKRVGKAQPGI